MKKTLINKLATFGLGVAMTLSSCSGGGIVTPKPDPKPIPTNKAPTAYATVDKDHGEITNTFIYNTSGSTDDTSGLQSRLDFDGDGVFDSSYSPIGSTNHKYTVGGNYDPVVQVKDEKGLTDTYQIGKVGVLDPANNPITIELKVPKYIVANEEIEETINATDANNRPLTYQLNDGSGFTNVDIQRFKTFSGDDVGKRTIEAIVTNDYKIKNNVTKDIEIGSAIPYDAILTDKIDGIKYKVKAMNDGRFWMTENFKGEVGNAPCHDNNCDDNWVFGRYYNAAEVDQIGERIMILNGVEHVFRVATTNEWGALANTYGSSADLKYKEFSNGENVGATNASGLSLMLGGVYDTPVDFDKLGDLGVYMTLDNNGQGTKEALLLSKDNINISLLNNNPNGLRGSVRLVKVE